jgi:hypothetical protein
MPAQRGGVIRRLNVAMQLRNEQSSDEGTTKWLRESQPTVARSKRASSQLVKKVQAGIYEGIQGAREKPPDNADVLADNDEQSRL